MVSILAARPHVLVQISFSSLFTVSRIFIILLCGLAVPRHLSGHVRLMLNVGARFDTTQVDITEDQTDGIKIRESGAQAQRSARLGARLRRDEATGQ